MILIPIPAHSCFEVAMESVISLIDQLMDRSKKTVTFNLDDSMRVQIADTTMDGATTLIDRSLSASKTINRPTFDPDVTKMVPLPSDTFVHCATSLDDKPSAQSHESSKTVSNSNAT